MRVFASLMQDFWHTIDWKIIDGNSLHGFGALVTLSVILKMTVYTYFPNCLLSIMDLKCCSDFQIVILYLDPNYCYALFVPIPSPMIMHIWLVISVQPRYFITRLPLTRICEIMRHSCSAVHIHQHGLIILCWYSWSSITSCINLTSLSYTKYVYISRPLKIPGVYHEPYQVLVITTWCFWIILWPAYPD